MNDADAFLFLLRYHTHELSLYIYFEVYIQVSRTVFMFFVIRFFFVLCVVLPLVFLGKRSWSFTLKRR